ncbi:unnamed protein product, partial [Rangifer tarandus platyrhynchus]
ILCQSVCHDIICNERSPQTQRENLLISLILLFFLNYVGTSIKSLCQLENLEEINTLLIRHSPLQLTQKGIKNLS